MIHIILAILKIFGILILILLGIILFFLLAALFCPFVYRVKIKRETGMPEGTIYLSWLAWLISAKAEYRDKRLEVTIRLFGISIKHFKTVFQLLKKIVHPLVAWYRMIIPGRQKPVQKPEYGDAQEDDIEEKTKSRFSTDKMSHEKTKQESLEKEEKVSIWQKIKSIALQIISLPKRILGILRKIYLTIREICGRIKEWKQFLTAETTRKALSFLMVKGKAVLHHVKPKKIKGNLKFGFDDPATTGQILAGFSVLYSIYKQKLTIIPVFNEQVFECDLYMRGHILGCVLVKAAWDIYRNKNVKRTIRRFQHKEA